MFFRNVTKDRSWRIERKTVTFNASGNLSVPYGKSIVTIAGAGQPGNPSIPGQPGNPTPAQPGSPTGYFNPPEPGNPSGQFNPPQPYPAQPAVPGYVFFSRQIRSTDDGRPYSPITDLCISRYGPFSYFDNSPGDRSGWEPDYAQLGLSGQNVLALYTPANTNDQLAPGTTNPLDQPGERFQGTRSNITVPGIGFLGQPPYQCYIGVVYYVSEVVTANPGNPAGANSGNENLNPPNPGNENFNSPTPNPPNPTNPAQPGTAGQPFSVFGINFPGGPAGGNAPSVAGTPVYLPYLNLNNLSVPITIPSGGSVNITFD